MRNLTRQSHELKAIEKILSIRVFNLSVTLLGCRTSDVKEYEHKVLWNCKLSDSLLISIKFMSKSPIKKQNLSVLFSFSKSRVKYSVITIFYWHVRVFISAPTDKIIFLGRLTSIKFDSRLLSKEILRSLRFIYENLSFM